MTPSRGRRVPRLRTSSLFSDHLWRPPRARVGEPLLGRPNSKHDDMLGVDPDAVARVGLNQPHELHDRTPGSSENRALDILGLPLNAVAISTEDDDLGGERWPGCLHAQWATCASVVRRSRVGLVDGCGMRARTTLPASSHARKNRSIPCYGEERRRETRCQTHSAGLSDEDRTGTGRGEAPEEAGARP
jgi:hypothetical protein